MDKTKLVDATLWTHRKMEFFRKDEVVPDIFGRHLWVLGLVEEVQDGHELPRALIFVIPDMTAETFRRLI